MADNNIAAMLASLPPAQAQQQQQRLQQMGIGPQGQTGMAPGGMSSGAPMRPGGLPPAGGTMSSSGLQPGTGMAPGGSMSGPNGNIGRVMGVLTPEEQATQAARLQQMGIGPQGQVQQQQPVSMASAIQGGGMSGGGNMGGR